MARPLRYVPPDSLVEVTCRTLQGRFLLRPVTFSGSTTTGAGSEVGRSKTGVLNQIRTLRFHHAQMTQQDLADRIGVTRQTVNAIEGSKYSPSLEVAFRIAEVFDVPLEEVFQYERPLE